MSEEKVDLSALDPARDRQRWEGLVQSVASRAVAARRRRLTVGHQLAAWARPTLAIAAAIPLLVWAGALASSDKTETKPTTTTEPAFALARWAASSDLPSTAELLQVLGGSHDDR